MKFPERYAIQWTANWRLGFWLIGGVLIGGLAGSLAFLVMGSVVGAFTAALTIGGATALCTYLAGFLLHHHWLLIGAEENSITRRYSSMGGEEEYDPKEQDQRFRSWWWRATVIMVLTLGIVCLLIPGGPSVSLLIAAVIHWFPPIATSPLAVHAFVFIGMFTACSLLAAFFAWTSSVFSLGLAKDSDSSQHDEVAHFTSPRIPFARGMAWGFVVAFTLIAALAVVYPAGVLSVVSLITSLPIPEAADAVVSVVAVALSVVGFAGISGVLNKWWEEGFGAEVKPRDSALGDPDNHARRAPVRRVGNPAENTAWHRAAEAKAGGGELLRQVALMPDGDAGTGNEFMGQP